jgi:ferredoxin
MTDTGAVIGEDCKGCGRCVIMCPEQAITMTFDAGLDTVGDILEAYKKRTNVWASKDDGA